MKINPYNSTAKYVARGGIFLSIALVLTYFESLFSVFLPNGVRLGLSNVAIMTSAVIINPITALAITFLKGIFVFMTRGFSAGALSLCGGILAFLVMYLFFKFTKSSYVFVSVFSAVAHSFGQVLMSVFLTGSIYTFYYFPILLITSVISGVLTGFIAGAVIKSLPKKIE